MTAHSPQLSREAKTGLPVHVAMIMDGNGRWAKERSLPRVEGHRNGVESVRAVVRAAGEVGLDVVDQPADDALHGFHHAAGAVRRQVGVRQRAQGMVRGQRLLIEDINGRHQIAAAQPRDQGVGVHQRGARHVDQQRVRR